jgi:hypothetical protein
LEINVVDKWDEAFSLCADNLAQLPARYKKWKTMGEYRSIWHFIQHNHIKENICESHMAFHYLYSLGLWLKPVLTIRIGHNLLCLQTVSAIFEAALLDLVSIYVEDKVLYTEICKWPAYKIRKYLFDIKALNKSWKDRIDELNRIRNHIHLNKNRNINIANKLPISHRLHSLDVDALEGALNEFVKYIKPKFVMS